MITGFSFYKLELMNCVSSALLQFCLSCGSNVSVCVKVYSSLGLIFVLHLCNTQIESYCMWAGL